MQCAFHCARAAAHWVVLVRVHCIHKHVRAICDMAQGPTWPQVFNAAGQQVFDSGFAGTTYGDATGPVFSAAGDGCAGLSGPLRSVLKSLQVMCTPPPQNLAPVYLPQGVNACLLSKHNLQRPPVPSYEGRAPGFLCLQAQRGADALALP